MSLDSSLTMMDETVNSSILNRSSLLEALKQEKESRPESYWRVWFCGINYVQWNNLWVTFLHDILLSMGEQNYLNLKEKGSNLQLNSLGWYLVYDPVASFHKEKAYAEIS